LLDSHFFEDSNGNFLKSIDLNGSLFTMGNIAIASTKFTNWAKLSTGETKRVVREDDFSSAIPVLVLNTVDECLNIDSCRATLLAGCIIAFQTSGCFSYCFLYSHEWDVSLPVVLLSCSLAVGCSVKLF
jgi:hypothetical protein